MTAPQSPATAGVLRQTVNQKVSSWFGEPVLAVEDEIMQLIAAELTSLLAKLPEKYEAAPIKEDGWLYDVGYNMGVQDSRAVIQEAITAIEGDK